MCPRNDVLFRACRVESFELGMAKTASTITGWAKKPLGRRPSASMLLDITTSSSAHTGGERSEGASLDQLVDRRECEEFDLIAVGRVPMCDIHWTEKVGANPGYAMKEFDPAAISVLV